MALTHDGETLIATDTHGDLLPLEAFELPIIREQFFGVQGEAHVIGSPLGRILDCRGLLCQFATRALLATAITDLEALAGTLTGDITMTRDAVAVASEPDCTFVGVQKLDPGVIYDASGVNGFMCHIRLIWIQRNEGT